MNAPANDRAPLAAGKNSETAGAASGANSQRLKDRVESVLATVFGAIFLGLAAIVCVETLSRKIFSFSLQGADELGGYVLALGSTLTFSLALMGRAHIRVDVVHEHLPARLQAALNLISIVALAALGVFICWVATQVLMDTLAYDSTAPTPWATPLFYPQLVWVIGLAVFAAIASVYALIAIGYCIRGRQDRLLSDFSPKSTKEELEEELDDLAQRQEETAS
ncbi:TRAP transporter small permease [Castellaniella sp. GW247-6E4]|uniref:TRAP transporter small permease subunit n=1 Tax=Castellaniella sp. GW247-6E4 TaxID=3140380 RepID=UPI003315DCDA